METYRLFVAAHIPDHVKAYLGSVQQHLKHSSAAVSWTAPQAMHLTFWFLGDPDSSRVGDFERALQDCQALPAPLVRLGQAGAFPSMQRARVVWMGLEGQLERLFELHRALGSALEARGVALERRPYHPHLTLGRIRRASTPDLAQLGERIRSIPPPPPTTWYTRHVSLFRSELLARGAQYTALATIELNA
ncbi:MAG TPA: RNA 2',3'-cyclic phosphodiesterase [Roseiflexaceae bacterium]|nr:RNA 2',3'-cyclic phosphodiesterase [Roseiflexaceae bacterium]